MTPVAIHRGMARDSFAVVAVTRGSARSAGTHRARRPGWERPPSPRAWYGFGGRCVCAPAPALLGSLPIQESLGGKAIERRSERGGSMKRSGLRASTLTSRQSRLRSSPIDHGNQSDRSSGGRSPWCADAVWPARDVNTTARPNGHTVTTCPRTCRRDASAKRCRVPASTRQRMSPSASGKSWPFTSMTVALSVAVSPTAALTKTGETFSTMAKATQSNANHRGSGSDVRSSRFSTPRHALDTFVAPRGPPSSQLRQAAAAVDHHVNDRVFRCRGGSGGVQRLPGLPPRSGLRVSAESNA